MFMVRAGIVIGVASYFDDPRSHHILLMSYDCDRWYFSLSILYMLNPRKSLISPSSVIPNPDALMAATICLIPYSYGTYRIESSVYSIYMIFPLYNTHS